MSKLELPPEEMRRLGYEVVDLLVRRWSELSDGPAWIGGTRRELERLLREPPPEKGRDPNQVIKRAVDDVLSRAGRIDHPRFFAFVPGSPTWPSVLADLMAAGFNTFQGTWLESAGPSQLELVVINWFRDWLGLPEGGGGLMTSGGSAANLIAMVAAREAAGNPERPAVYISDQGHSSLERAAWIGGIPREAVTRIPVDGDYRLSVPDLREQVTKDRSEGITPVAVCLNAGATNTGAVDPLREAGRYCREEGIWCHVDGAYGGFAVLTPEGKARLDGIDLADTVTLDPHKWLFQPFEAGCLLARDAGALEDTFRILPEYLQDTELGKEHVNFADRGIQLTRRFRALKVWMSIQMLGLEAFRDAVGLALEYADRAGKWIKDSEVLELLSTPSLGVVCYRFRPRDWEPGTPELEELNVAIQDELVQSGFAMLSSTRLNGQYSLRLCIMNYRTRWEDVEETLNRVEAVGRRMAG